MRKSPKVEAPRRGPEKPDLLTPEEQQQAARLISRELFPAGTKGSLEVTRTGAIGARDSGHGVFFVNDQKGDAFAVKRFRGAEDAEAELSATARAAKLGFKTLDVVGGYSLGELGTAVVTRRMPNLTTMNQIGWQDAQPGTEQYEEIAATLRSIGDFSGEMHARGMTHGDWQIKNVAVTLATGELSLEDFDRPPSQVFVAHDLEGATFAEDTDPFIFEGYCAEDLQTLTKSLVERGFLRSATPRVFQEELTDNLFVPYWEQTGSDRVFDLWQTQILPEAFKVREQSGSSQVAAMAGMVATGAALQ